VKVEVKTGGSTVDTYLAPLGFRTFAFSGSCGFSLNGQNLKLQGVCKHHDLGALGAAVNYRAMERQVEKLRDMGVNAIRTSHNPPAPELLELADRLGVMMIDEAFDVWESGKTTNDCYLYSKDWAQRDRNHPSVIMWSIGNEIGGPNPTTAQNLKNWVIAVDKTRR
jgi:beta-galactosidase